MKGKLLISVLVAGLAIAACSSSNNNSSVTPAPVNPFGSASPSPSVSPSPVSSAWSDLNEKTTCEAMNPSTCVGFYNFTLTNTGTWQVGPGPANESQSGQITASEMILINNDATAVAQASPQPTPQCETSTSPTGVSDVVNETFGTDSSMAGQSLDVYADQGGQQVCYRGGKDNATKLHTDFKALMQKYYPNPFPAASASPSPSP